jgi:hypothetical protein
MASIWINHSPSLVKAIKPINIQWIDGFLIEAENLHNHLHKLLNYYGINLL